jgi:hypothetical protein
MTIDRASLRAAIAGRKLADWVLTESHRQGVTHATSDGDTRWGSDDRKHLRVLVRRDLPSGRGTGVVELQERTGDPRAVISQAVALAEAAIEPSWSTPPAAAPARVALLDEELAKADAGVIETTAARLAASVHKAVATTGLELVDSQLRVEREETGLSSAQGFEVRWRESRFEIALTVRRGGQLANLRRCARRIVDLDLHSTLTAIASDLAQPATSMEPPSVPVALEFGVEPMLGDDDRGLWRAITDQADARAARRDLTRYQRSAMLPAGDRTLTVWSDGTLPYGTHSAPVGLDGEAVRRFRLLGDGVMGEPGMGPQEAALRGRSPNGGVRNLVVSAGTAPVVTEQEHGAPILEVRKLRWLRIDPANGHAEGELALAIDRESGKPIRRGGFALDLLLGLATATRSATLVRRGAYLGPAWIRLRPLRLTP